MVYESQFDPVGTLEHEISEVLGRVAYADADKGSQAIYSLLDMFRYTTPHSPEYNEAAPSYFSYDGQTLTLPFDTQQEVAPPPTGQGLDVGDWDPSLVGNDAFAGTAPNGSQSISRTDIDEMQVLGYDLVPSRLIGAELFTPASGGVDLEIYSVDPGTGNINQIGSNIAFSGGGPLGLQIGAEAALDGHLYFVTDNGNFYTVDTRTGEVINTVSTGTAPTKTSSQTTSRASLSA